MHSKMEDICHRVTQAVVIGFVISCISFFVGASITLAETTPVWGQAYSPNSGWINFYCNNGDSDPSVFGTQSLPEICEESGENYEVLFDSTTNIFSGYAYSPNYGWFDMNGVQLKPDNKLYGITTGSEILNYYFGDTTFHEVASAPGVNFDGDSGIFKDFAYSEEIGWISFSTPEDPDLQAIYGSVEYAIKMAKVQKKVVWGQAYSPNIGWINFYCDGVGSTQPPGVDSNFGATSMPDACNDISYGVSSKSGILAGNAYSPNYGWLNLDGATLDSNGDMQGTSNNGGMAPYNFGNTYFASGEPSAENPGVRYKTEGYFCGFAYSDEAGFISFCDPQTKDGSGSVSGYDYDTYAVYMGSDTTPPELVTSLDVFAADANKSILLSFVDDNEVASASVIIKDSNDIPQTYSTSTPGNPIVLSFTHDFSLAQNYDLQYETCDISDVCKSETIPNFFTVVTGIPASGEFQFGSPIKIADGQNFHFVQAKLFDQYGNIVTSVTDVKEIQINFNFENTTALDQIANDGDSAIFTKSDLTLIKEGVETGSIKIIDTGFLTETDGLGIFRVNVFSYSPTSAGYTPIENDGFHLNFENIEYEITALNGHSNVGEISGADPIISSSENRIFNFSPTLTATLEAMNYDPDNPSSDENGYLVEDSANDNVTINAPKRFLVTLNNASSNQNVSADMEIGLVADTSDDDIIWNSGTIEKTDIQTELSVPLTLDTSAESFTPGWNDITSLIDQVSTEDSRILRIKATPGLTSGATTPGNFNTVFQAYAGYTVNGKHVRHKSEMLGGSGTSDASIYNTAIQIIGAVYSSQDVYSNLETDDDRESVGDVARNEAKTAIDRNTTPFLKDLSVTGCSNDITISDGELEDNTGTTSCLYREKKVLFMDGGDLTLEDTNDDIVTLPNSPSTILVYGGDVHIKSNLVYPGEQTSFGLVVYKNEFGEGGNVFIYPDVTNIASIVYAEGSVISVNRLGEFGEDGSSACDGSQGFCDRSSELHNQLYWKGAIATVNTVGGSDSDPFICPREIASCDSREIARTFDFNYLRTFHESSGGIRAGENDLPDPPGGTENNYALIIEYDSRIATNPPPIFSAVGSSGSGEVGY